MPWLKSYKTSFELRGALVSAMGHKVGLFVLLVCAGLVGFSLLSEVNQSKGAEKHFAETFIDRCESGNEAEDCEALVEVNGAKCFRVADNFEQYYPCTLKSYEVWGKEYRAARALERKKQTY